VPEGFEIPKGARIDLMVGDGLGNQVLNVPDLVGMEEIEAEFLILGSGLRVGNKKIMDTDSVAPGRVFLQSPAAGMPVNTGELIDLWVAKGNL
jgi:beta-lactam-binding protein with PASTA domain